MEDTNYGLPIGVCRQAVMKLDSFIADTCEIIGYENISPENKAMFEQINEMGSTMIAAIVNTVASEMGEEEFIGEKIPMDEIQPFPESDLEIDDMAEEITIN